MKGMSKGIGPNRLGAPKGVGKMMKKAPMKMQKTSDLSQMRAKSPMKIGMEPKSAAKIMKKSPMEIGMKPKSPAKKSTRLSNKEKAAMMAKKRAAGTDAASMRRKELNKEVRKQLKGKSTFGAAGAETTKKAVAAAEKEVGKKLVRGKSPAKIAKEKKSPNKIMKKSPAKVKKGGKMPMAKDPKTGKMVPAFAIDGKGKNDSAAKLKQFGKKTKGEMGSGFYVGADGKRSKTPASERKIVKKAAKRKVQKPITAVKPKRIPKIVK